MPGRDDPRLTIRLSGELDGRLEGAAAGAGVAKGALARRAMELGFREAVVEARGGGMRAANGLGGEVDASPAARGELPVVGGGDGNGDAAGRSPGRAAKPSLPPTARLDEVVAPVVGDMVRARRAINAGLVRVGGRVVRDPMARVDPALVAVES